MVRDRLFCHLALLVPYSEIISPQSIVLLLIQLIPITPLSSIATVKKHSESLFSQVPGVQRSPTAILGFLLATPLLSLTFRERYQRLSEYSPLPAMDLKVSSASQICTYSTLTVCFVI